jgi:tetratricopeptide (TPR) repeat protein
VPPQDPPSFQHLTPDQLTGLGEERLSPEAYGEQLTHLALCPECRQALTEIYPSLDAALDRDLLGLDPRPLDHLDAEDKASLSAFPATLAALRQRPVGAWALLVSNLTEFRHPVVLGAYLDEVDDNWFGARGELLAMVDAVVRTLETRSPQPAGREAAILCRAYCFAGNLRRTEGAYDEALGYFDKALALLPAAAEAGGILVFGEFHMHLGNLQRNMGDVPAAIDNLRVASHLLRRRGPAAATSYYGPLLLLALLLQELGDWKASERELATIHDTAGPPPHKAQYLSLLQIHGVNLARLGKAREARALLPEIHSHLPLNIDSASALKVKWLEGLICAAEGNYLSARLALAAVFAGYQRLTYTHDTALAGLDLAALDLDHGHPDRAAALAADLHQVFKALEIDREALTSLLLLTTALRDRSATSAAVAQAMELVRTQQRS